MEPRLVGAGVVRIGESRMSWLRFLLRLFRIGRPRRAAAPTETEEATTPVSARPTIFVVIGLDFGTSGTKVVVRLLDKGRPASAVDFGTDQAGFSRSAFRRPLHLRILVLWSVSRRRKTRLAPCFAPSSAH